MTKRSFALLLVVALVISSFAGMAVTSAQDEVTIQLMGWSSSEAENAALQAMVDAFMDQNPNINVELSLVPEYDTTLQAAFASGDAPNVFYVDSSRLPDFVEAGVIAPAGENYEDVEGLFPSLVEVFTLDDTFYCPAKDFSTLALQYNKDLFDAAGLEYPTNDWTWDELRAAAEALTNDDVVGLVVPAELPRWLPFLYQAGGSVLNEEGTESTFDSDATMEALDFYLGMVEDGIAAPPSDVDAGWGGEAFGKASVAMAMEGNWAIQFLADNYPDTNWGVVELPAGPAGEATMAFTVCYGVAADNDNPDESWVLVNFLTGEEGAMMIADAGFGVMPPRPSAAERWLEVRGAEFEPFVTGAEVARPYQFPAGVIGLLEPALNNALREAMAGNLVSEDVISDVSDVLAEALGE